MICVIKTDRDIFFISLFKSHWKLYSFPNTNYKSKLVKKRARNIPLTLFFFFIKKMKSKILLLLHYVSMGMRNDAGTYFRHPESGILSWLIRESFRMSPRTSRVLEQANFATSALISLCILSDDVYSIETNVREI